MGTFKFSWAHPAEEVYVTGTFDNWTKSEKLEKVGDVFEKVVTLPDASKKIYYKFVVDNNWVTDHTAQQEPDHEGNVNNFLTPEQIVKEDSSAAIMNTVTPESTTAALAKEVPLEEKTEPKATPSDVPGSFPLTPANELDKVIGINPLPATEGGENPIKLAPGEPIPPSAQTGDINDHVKLDKESYEKADTIPGMETELPPVTNNMIPESSLPIVSGADVTISSVAPHSTTAALAGEVPLEPKVPQTVKESQEKAHVDPEASAIPEEVKEKAAVEEELLQKVPEAPSTSEGTSGFGTQKSEDVGVIAATAATAGGVALAAAIAAKDLLVGKTAPAVEQATVVATDAAAKLPEPVKEALPVSAQEAIETQAKEETREEVSPSVPEEVKESIQESGKSPEEAANTEAVEEKKAVEAELLKEVKEVPAVEEAKTEEPAKAAETPAVAETKTEEPVKEANGTEAAAPTTPAKSTAEVKPETTPSSSKAAESPANGSTEKKKKNRLSTILSKIKHKVSSKDGK